MSAPAAPGAAAGAEAVVIVDWTPTWVTGPYDRERYAGAVTVDPLTARWSGREAT